MENILLVPNRKADRVVLEPMYSDFWDNDWKKNKIDSEKFESRISYLSETLDSVLQKKLPFNENYYIEVSLDEKSQSKSSTPSNIWLQTDIDIVEAPDKCKLVVSGNRNEVEKFKIYASSATYERAKNGENIKRKDKNIYRELYAITSINDKSLSQNRKDQDLQELEEQGYQGRIKCIIELYNNIPKSKYDKYFDLIIHVLPNTKLIKRDLRYLYHNLSYISDFTLEEINRILTMCSFIRKIRIFPSFKASRCIPSGDLNDLQLLKPETDEVIGIIDSGVNHKILNIYKVLSEKHVNGKRENHNHGTFVTSRALFGDNLFELIQNKKPLAPCAKFIDFQFLYDEDGIPELEYETFKKEIEGIFQKYHTQIAIFNFSTNDRSKDQDISEFTEHIDMLCRKYDIIFINSAGNQDYFGGLARNYLDIFKNVGFDSKVKAPGDGLNVLTVGSIALKVNDKCICDKVGFPSPFTRKGPVHFGWKKPELVDHGGNVLLTPGKDINDDEAILGSNNVVGVSGLNTKGLATDRGTSTSAPLVTRQSVYLLNILKKSSLINDIVFQGNRSNLIKALLIHSTSLIKQVDIEDQGLRDAYGFGQADYSRLMSTNNDEVRIIYADKLTNAEKIHRFICKLPGSLMGRKLKFIFTSVYNPAVNKNFQNVYNLTQVASTVKIIKPEYDDDQNILETKKYYISPNSRDWHSYRHRNFNVTHFSKVVKKLNYPIIEIISRLYFSSFHTDVGSEIQHYSFVLTIIDEEKKGTLFDEIMASNQFKIVVDNQVELSNEIS